MSETANLLDVKFTEDIFFELMPEWKGSAIKIKNQACAMVLLDKFNYS